MHHCSVQIARATMISASPAHRQQHPPTLIQTPSLRQLGRSLSSLSRRVPPLRSRQQEVELQPQTLGPIEQMVSERLLQSDLDVQESVRYPRDPARTGLLLEAPFRMKWKDKRTGHVSQWERICEMGWGSSLLLSLHAH
jgi:hypothetical protein